MIKVSHRPAYLEHTRLVDCMHQGIVSCVAGTPLEDVAEIMSRTRVHAVAVTDAPEEPPVGFVSDLDIVSAAADGVPLTALQAAVTEPLVVSADESPHRAAQLMSEHAVTHLIVLDAADGHPSGVVSSLDIAAEVGERPDN